MSHEGDQAGSVPLSSRLVRLPRGRMHVMTSGRDGIDAVVLLHGWPGFWFDYRHVIPLVAGRSRVVALDFLGFGHSDPPRGEPTMAADESAFAQDVLDCMAALGIGRALLVGHDIGSAVAPTVARLAPTRVRGLVLLNPTHPEIGDKRFTAAAQREAWYQHFHQLQLAEDLIDGDKARVAAYLGHFYNHWAGERHISDAEFQTIVDLYARPGAFGASIAWYRARAARRERARANPAEPVRIPVMALWGDRDPMRPLEHMEGFERTFPTSVTRVLHGVGHFVPAEAPNAVAEAISALG